MPERTTSQIVVAAPPDVVLDVVADLEAYPSWATGMAEVTVLESGADGRPFRARFVVDGGMLRDTHVMEYAWEVAQDGTGVVSWRQSEGSALRAVDGSYTIAREGAGALVTYRLSVEPAVAVPAFVRRTTERTVVSTALAGLRERAEAVAGASRRGGGA